MGSRSRRGPAAPGPHNGHSASLVPRRQRPLSSPRDQTGAITPGASGCRRLDAGTLSGQQKSKWPGRDEDQHQDQPGNTAAPAGPLGPSESRRAQDWLLGWRLLREQQGHLRRLTRRCRCLLPCRLRRAGRPRRRRWARGGGRPFRPEASRLRPEARQLHPGGQTLRPAGRSLRPAVLPVLLMARRLLGKADCPVRAISPIQLLLR